MFHPISPSPGRGVVFHSGVAIHSSTAGSVTARSIAAAKPRRRLVGFWVCVAATIAIGTSHALPPKKDLADPDRKPCEPRARIDIVLNKSGLPLIGTKTTVTANAKIELTEPDPEDFEGYRCVTKYLQIPPASHAWTFNRPPGSNATLSGTSTSSVSFAPDVVGAYSVIYTVSCPGGCPVPLSRGGTVLAPSASEGRIIEAADRIERPPETEPELPAMDFTRPIAIREGLTGGGVTDPQWVATEDWTGPEDYRMLEGWVNSSHISRKDSPLNHESQDFNFDVTPDPPYHNLLVPDQRGVEVEWERDHFPEFFRPTRGDRVSAMGYWIHDCGHNFKTEIHPPVMTATHRARPVRIPESMGLGSNIHVPGIVTDIWINREAGEITGNCSATGLHNPPFEAVLPNGSSIHVNGDCLPFAAGFNKNPINREYEFNIYLPRDPRFTSTRVGMQVPEIPLHFLVVDANGTVFDPVVTRTQSGNATYLKVRVDLGDYPGDTYARRIEAAWAYPSPHNWGLKSWRVSINSMDVDDDGDGTGSGDGDWRFWVNVNNGDQEWTKLFDCDGCVHGVERFGGTPWATGFPNIPNSLGPDIRLFPDQKIWVHASGFENDWAVSDSTGHVSRLHPQEVRSYSADSHCTSSFPSGCCRYTLNYDIVEGIPVGKAQLTPEGSALYEAYTLRPGELSNRPGKANLAELVEAFPVAIERVWNHPDELNMDFHRGPVLLANTSYPKMNISEPNVLTDIGKDALYTHFIETLDKGGELKIAAFANELIEEIRNAGHTVPLEEIEAGLESIRESVPDFVWEQIQPAVDEMPTATPSPAATPEVPSTPTPTPSHTPTPVPA